MFGHSMRSFVFLANFAKNDKVASQDLKSSETETRNVFDFGYFGCLLSNTPYLRPNLENV